MGVHSDAAEYDTLWTKALSPIAGAEWRSVTVLRDYHAENIMLLDDGAQGLIDYQDALAGHPAYDLVSILQDARRDVPPELEAKMLDHYAALTGASAEFRSHYALLGAQRNTKIIGIFTRLWQRDGKARYLDFLPRMWGMLERDLAHPELAPLQAWFDRNIPQETRRKSPLEFSPR
jgi:N-acetylmuramate 1-kinase